MPLPIPFFPDSKIHKIEDSTNPFTIGQTRTLTHTSPPDRLCILESIAFDSIVATMTLQVTSIKVDDVEMLSTQNVLAASASKLYFEQKDHEMSTVVDLKCEIPFRRSVVVTIVSAVIAGDVKWEMWAMIHQDRDKQFRTEASMQGQ